MPENLIKSIKKEDIKKGKEQVDNIKNELERYLFQHVVEGEDKKEKIVSKTV